VSSSTPLNSICYRSLAQEYRRALRNRSWSRLSLVEKGLLRCSLWIAESRGGIRNLKLTIQLEMILRKLGTSIRNTILRIGSERAEELRRVCESRGAFKWAHDFFDWLGEPSFKMYLGMLMVNGH